MTKTPKKPKLIGCVGHDCEACRRTRRDARTIVRSIRYINEPAIGLGEAEVLAKLLTIYRAAKRIAARGEGQKP